MKCFSPTDNEQEVNRQQTGTVSLYRKFFGRVLCIYVHVNTYTEAITPQYACMRTPGKIFTRGVTENMGVKSYTFKKTITNVRLQNSENKNQFPDSPSGVEGNVEFSVRLEPDCNHRL